jgi:hypothetical protein
MEKKKKKKKVHKGGNIVRFEPQGLQLLESNPIFKESLQAVGCLAFCEKLHGGHMDVDKQFSLNFDGVKTKVGSLEIQVNKQRISSATGIPLQGERWFNGTPLESSYNNEYFKTKFQN